MSRNGSKNRKDDQVKAEVGQQGAADGGEDAAADSASPVADAGAPEQEEAPAASDIQLSSAPADADPEDDEDYESEDSLTFSNGVIEKIVAIAMRDVPGVIGMKGGWINRVQETFGVNDQRKGVVVEVTPDSAVKVNISVLIEYGSYAPQVFEDVKKTVVKQVTGMTGLRVAGVNLRIEDVLTPEEYEAGRRAEREGADVATAAGSVEAPAEDAATPAGKPADDASAADVPSASAEAGE